MTRGSTRRERSGSLMKLLGDVDKIRRSLSKEGIESNPAVYTPCDILTINVIRGHKITNGYLDYIDTPDPYLKLKIENAAIPTFRTAHVDDCIDPEWNEKFTFHIAPEAKHVLEITLMDSNPLGLDVTIGSLLYDVSDIRYEENTEKTFTLKDGSKLDFAFLLRRDTSGPDLRYSLDICQQEKQFLKARRSVVFEKMKEMFEGDGPRSENEVPTVSIIGSGGGFRAMVGMAGVYKALADCGILDVTTYVGALSGSSWLISTLYSDPKFPEALSPNDPSFLEEMKEKIDQSLIWLLSPTRLSKYYGYLSDKSKRGQPVTFTDIFGLLVGETLIPDRMDCCLSDQQDKVINGSAPMPLYEGLHVKKDVSASIFGEHVEFNPFEVGMEEYGIYMDIALFGSRFFGGKMVKRFPESKLHYLQGVLGSAFTILFRRLVEKDTKRLIVEDKLREELNGELLDDMDDMDDKIPEQEDATDGEDESTGWGETIKQIFSTSEYFNSRKGRAAVVHNFLRNVQFKTELEVTKKIYSEVRDLNKLFMVDAGLSFNSPFPMVLRRHRNVDLILSFDFSGRESNDPPFKELLLAELWAKEHNKPFPPIDLSVYEKHGLQEVFVFEDKENLECPIVLHFPLVNEQFRNYTFPGVPRLTEEEKEFADFDIFADDSPYSTFNFNYPHEAFDRLTQLTEFNTRLKMPEIREAILRRLNLKRGQNTPMAEVVFEDDNDLWCVE